MLHLAQIIYFCKGTKHEVGYQRSTAEGNALAAFDTRENSGHIMMNGMGYKRHWNGFIPVCAHHSFQIKTIININFCMTLQGVSVSFESSHILLFKGNIFFWCYVKSFVIYHHGSYVCISSLKNSLAIHFIPKGKLSAT